MWEANGTFRMAELGAGWAPWLVRAASAAKQIPEINGIELLGVEADPTHFRWMMDHFIDNEVSLDVAHLLHGAVASKKGIFRFPKITEPDVDYGSSIKSTHAAPGAGYIDVQGFTLEELIGKFSGRLTSCMSISKVPNTMLFRPTCRC